MAVHYFYRHHIVSYPIKERVNVVISRGNRKYSAYVNVLSRFSTGFPDSTGSLEADDWPLQFRLPNGDVMYASIANLFIAPDHVADRTYITDSGVERRDHAIKLYTGKSLVLCDEVNRFRQIQGAFLSCPTFFRLRVPGSLNSIELINGPDATHRLANGWRVDSVSITLNNEPVFEPDISELPNLPSDHRSASRFIAGRLGQKEVCANFSPGQNPFCKEFEIGLVPQESDEIGNAS